MSFNPFDFNNDGEVSFGEGIAAGMFIGGASYLAGQDSYKYEMSSVREQYEQELERQRIYNWQLKEDLEKYKTLYFKTREAAQCIGESSQNRGNSSISPSYLKAKEEMRTYSKRGKRMSAYKCELCGGTEFSRTEDGEYVCRGCGVIFPAEQLKAMTSELPQNESVGGAEIDNYENNWPMQLEEIAQSHLDVRDFRAVEQTWKQFERECREQDIKYPGRASQLLFCLNTIAKSADDILNGDRSSIKVFGGAIRRYLNQFALFKTPHDWFSNLATPTVSFENINVEIARVLFDRLAILQDAPDFDGQLEFDSLRRDVAALLVNQPASALSALEAIYVMVSRGYALPSDAGEVIDAFEESLSGAMTEIVYVQNMISDLNSACWGNGSAPKKILCTVQSKNEDVISEAASLLEQNDFILAKAVLEFLPFCPDSNDRDGKSDSYVSFIGHLARLYDEIVKTYAPFSLDFMVEMRIKDFNEDLSLTEKIIPTERFHLIKKMCKTYFDVASEASFFLTMTLCDIRDEDPFKYNAYAKTEEQFSLISEAVLDKSTAILLKMVQNDELSFTEALKATCSLLTSNVTRLCFAEKQFEQIRDRTVSLFKSALCNTQLYIDKFNVKSGELNHQIETIDNKILQAEETIQSLGILKVAEKNRLNKSIKQLREEKASITSRLDSLADTLKEEIWDEITKETEQM